ncbi:56kda selenium binding protein (SBP56) [Physcia stellaris]|nr:56kda selenium binding protein (SBP56) [Physcia stellaris]
MAAFRGLSSLVLGYLAVSVLANPIPEAEPDPDPLSLPPLIPSVPGFTDPIGTLAPPLPVLQVPTPAKPSPPFTGSDIKPKKIGYFWTAAGDNDHADFLAAYSLDDDTFGTFLWLVDVPTSGNSPHHLGSSKDGKTLVGGGLLSLLKVQDTAFYFDVSNPYRPAFKKSNRALTSAVTDEIRAKPDGGFLITYMGSAAGTSPGRLVETDSDFNIIAEHPQDAASNANILAQNFNPHGLSVDWDKNIILTSDYVVPLSILKPSLGIIRDNTLRLWNLEKRSIISTITIPDGGGIQDVKFILGNAESAALATAVHLGQIWIIYPFRKDANGNQGVAKLFYDLGPKARDTTAIYSDLSQNGKFFYATITTGNHIAALDISDLDNPKRLDDPDSIQPTIGPHYIKVTPDQKHIVVTDYFVQTGQIGLINTPADFKALYIDINPDGSLHFNRSIDFTGPYTNRGGAKPHSAVVFDLTDPNNPYYY